MATKKLVVAKLLDKLSGFLSLAFLALSLLLFSRMLEVPSLLIFLIILFGIGSYYLVYKKFLPVFAPYFIKTHIRALGLQGSQIICAMFILKSLGYPGPYIPYLVIFTISSMVALFPLTVGGLGPRELVLLYGARMFDLDPQLAVSSSLIFFAISLISSLPGLYFVVKSSSLLPEKNVVNGIVYR